MAKATADIRSLARAQTALAIRTLTGVCSSKAAPAAARVSAAGILLDRGWGKAVQMHSDADGGPIQVIIRQIVDVCGEAEPVLIDHDDGCDEA
jgi:hypothetical protein